MRGDYTGENGQQRELRVPVEAPRNADPYQMLLSGMARMRELVNELLEASLDPMAASDSDEASDGEP